MNSLRTFGTSCVLHSTQQSCSCEGQREDGFLLLQPGLSGFQAEKLISSSRLVLALECITHPEGVQSFLEGCVFFFFWTIQRPWSVRPQKFGAKPMRKFIQEWPYISVSQRQRCDNIKAANTWARIQEQLFGELGLWGQTAEATPCSRWELDWREGPARMRKRIRRLSPLETLSPERLKVSVGHSKTMMLPGRKDVEKCLLRISFSCSFHRGCFGNALAWVGRRDHVHRKCRSAVIYSRCHLTEEKKLFLPGA